MSDETLAPRLDRRRPNRHPDAARGLWFRHLSPQEIIGWLTLIGLLLGATGWRFYSVTSLEDRVAKIEVSQQRTLDVLCEMRPGARACKGAP